MRASRLNKIVEFVNDRELVSFNDLCDEFKVSSATMRRDVYGLIEEGLIDKVHGGVRSILTKHQFEPPVSKRQEMNVEEKKRIATHALSLIHNGDIIILDSSTTITELAKLLAHTTLEIVVITNDTNIASILAYAPTIEIILIGGVIRKGFFTALGTYSEEMWKKFHANKLFLGVDAVSHNHGIMGYHTEEIVSKQLMIDISDECIVLCDHTKFSNIALFSICPISAINKIITSTELNDSMLQMYEGFKETEIIQV